MNRIDREAAERKLAMRLDVMRLSRRMRRRWLFVGGVAAAMALFFVAQPLLMPEEVVEEPVAPVVLGEITVPTVIASGADDEILAFEPSSDESENIEAMNGFMQRWQGIGFVPFKEKDNIAKKYKDALQAKFPGISVSKARRSASRTPKSEKELLVQKYMKKEQDIITYENNIGFFAMSKNSEPLIRQMQDRIAQAKKELQELETRIRELESAEEKE